MARKSVYKFSDDPEGWRDRLRLAVKWSGKVLGTTLAQNPRVTSLGMEMGLMLEVHPEEGVRVSGMTLKDVPEVEDFGLSLSWGRLFRLKSESIYWESVVDAMRGLAGESEAGVEVEQVAHIWSRQPFKRVFYMKTDESGNHVLPEGGVDGGYVADRLLYSEFAHADDASDILDHVDGQAQMWNLAGMVADWMATLSYQERVIQLVAPDVLPELTSWAGNPRTIFDRMGAKVVVKNIADDGEAARSTE